MTQGQLQERLKTELGVSLSRDTIASYEAGSSQYKLASFIQLCFALRLSPEVLLGQAGCRYLGKSQLIVSLRWTQFDHPVELRPFQDWALLRLREILPGQDDRILLSLSTVENLAYLCGVSPNDLYLYLRGAPRGDCNSLGGDQALHS
ncbi:hypothetical protein [Amycolatopsis sp. A1MSW2902]|uniref:hypothetical protein n=1 Tax=Amycolatopsis sp. A1MSW2902 TaxID=687413 RepID=UPI00307DA089